MARTELDLDHITAVCDRLAQTRVAVGLNITPTLRGYAIDARSLAGARRVHAAFTQLGYRANLPERLGRKTRSPSPAGAPKACKTASPHSTKQSPGSTTPATVRPPTRSTTESAHTANCTTRCAQRSSKPRASSPTRRPRPPPTTTAPGSWKPPNGSNATSPRTSASTSKPLRPPSTCTASTGLVCPTNKPASSP